MAIFIQRPPFSVFKYKTDEKPKGLFLFKGLYFRFSIIKTETQSWPGRNISAPSSEKISLAVTNRQKISMAVKIWKSLAAINTIYRKISPHFQPIKNLAVWRFEISLAVTNRQKISTAVKIWKSLGFSPHVSGWMPKIKKAFMCKGLHRFLKK